VFRLWSTAVCSGLDDDSGNILAQTPSFGPHGEQKQLSTIYRKCVDFHKSFIGGGLWVGNLT